MTKDDFQNLKPGDVVRHQSGGANYLVTATYGDRVTAVRTIDMTNPIEWVVVLTATHVHRDS